MLLCICQGNLHIIKKDTFGFSRSNASLKIGFASEITLCEIRCFYYLYNKFIIMNNKSNIIVNREVSLLVIISPAFL